MPRAFVLGGSGQIGWAVCGRFAAAGWDVTAASRGVRAAPPDVRLAQVDRTDTASLAAALGDGVDVLVDVLSYGEADGTQLNSLAPAIGSVVAISSASVYRDAEGRTLDEAEDLDSFPRLPRPIPETQSTVDPGEATYSTRKVAMEQALLEGPIPSTVVRPCAIHGPHGSRLREWHFVKRVLDGRTAIALPGQGESRFHTTSVANLAELVFLSATRPADRILNCGDPDPPTVLEIARSIAHALAHDWTEVPIDLTPFSDPDLDTPWCAPAPFVLDMATAEQELGYGPVTTYEEAVRTTAAWLVEAYHEGGLAHYPSIDYGAENAVLAPLMWRSGESP
jgi:nucleoside-diphosphate-sugar epimerase